MDRKSNATRSFLTNHKAAMDDDSMVVGIWEPIRQPDVSEILGEICRKLQIRSGDCVPSFEEYSQLHRLGFDAFYEREPGVSSSVYIQERIGEKPRKQRLPAPSPIASNFRETKKEEVDARNETLFRTDYEEYQSDLEVWERVKQWIDRHNKWIRHEYGSNVLPPVSYENRHDENGQIRDRLLQLPPRPRPPVLRDRRYDTTSSQEITEIDYEALEAARIEHEQLKATVEQEYAEALREYEQRTLELAKQHALDHDGRGWRVREEVAETNHAFQFVRRLFTDAKTYRTFLTTFSGDLPGYRVFLYYCYTKGVSYLEPLFQPRYLTIDRRLQNLSHSFTFAATRAGKSTLYMARIFQHLKKDMGRSGLLIIDPHRELARNIAVHRRICENDEHVFYFDPTIDPEYIPRINPLDIGEDRSRETIAFYCESLASALGQICGGSDSVTVNMATLLRVTIKLLLSIPGEPKTLLDLLALMSNDPTTLAPYLAHAHRLNTADRQYLAAKGAFFSSNIGSSKSAIQARLQSLLGNDSVLRILCQYSRSSVDISDLIRKKAIQIWALSASDIGEEGSAAIGRLLMAQVVAIARKHMQIADPNERPRCHVYVDEFQNYVSDASEFVLTEATKAKIHLHMCTQQDGQGMNSSFRKVVIANTAIKFIGKSSASQHKAYVDEVGLPLEEFQSLGQGMFVLHRGMALAGEKAHSPRIFRVSDCYFDDVHKVDEKTFIAFTKRQVKRYYLPDPSTAISSEKPAAGEPQIPSPTFLG